MYDCKMVFLRSDVHFGCILLFKWVGPIFLGVEMRVSMLILLYVCKLVQFGCTLIFKRVGATLVSLRCCKVLYTYDTCMLILLYICKLVGLGSH